MNLGYSYSYNGRGDLTNLSNPYGEQFSWTYLANDWLQTSQVNNSAVTTFTYNPLGQLLDLSNKSLSNTILSDYNMSGSGHYDGAGSLLGSPAHR